MKKVLWSILVILLLSISFVYAGPKAAPVMTKGQKALTYKIKKIIIPKVEMDDTDIRDACKLISTLSKENSKDGSKINIFVKLPGSMKKNPPKVTLNLTNIPLYELIKYTAMYVEMEMKVEEFAVMLYKPTRPGKKK